MKPENELPHFSQNLSDFASGAVLPLHAFRFIFVSRKLLRLSIIAATVTSIALLILAFALWPVASTLANYYFPDGTSHWIATVVLYLVLLLINALTVPALLLAPFQDPLSEATEEYIDGVAPPPFSFQNFIKSSLFSLRHSVGRMGLLAFGFLILLPLNLIPVVGSLGYAGLSALWAAWMLTLEHLSPPMARHLVTFREVRKTMRTYPWACLGFGLVLYALLWVPVLNFFLFPVATVGGTLLFRAFRHHLP